MIQSQKHQFVQNQKNREHCEIKQGYTSLFLENMNAILNHGTAKIKDILYINCFFGKSHA